MYVLIYIYKYIYIYMVHSQWTKIQKSQMDISRSFYYGKIRLCAKFQVKTLIFSLAELRLKF